MKFITTILQSGNNTGIVIPAEIVESFGAGKKPPVIVTMKGYSYRNTVAVMGGTAKGSSEAKFMVGISAEHRKGANVAGGETLEVTIELDTEPRTVSVPEDLQQALENDPAARQTFEALSYTYRKECARMLEDAKTSETRQRRLDKMIANLADGKKPH